MAYWTHTMFGRRWRPTGAGPLARAATALMEWHERVRQRYRLAELDDAALNDLGLSRADVRREIRKPFWQA